MMQVILRDLRSWQARGRKGVARGLRRMEVNLTGVVGQWWGTVASKAENQRAAPGGQGCSYNLPGFEAVPGAGSRNGE